MSDYNVSIADFKNKNRIVMTDTLYQYDYGQKLQIVNIAALPQTFEAHFSNVQHGGVSITVTGMDGIVDIPNTLLMTGKRIYCWIYVTEPGSGETVYQILLPVQHRPMPEYYDVTDVGVFDSVVQQVGDYAATATAGATSATASAAAAATSEANAAASASAAESAKTAAETAQGNAEDAQAAAETAAQTATQKAQQIAQDAAHAALDAGRAESAAGRAEAAETGAESAKTNAETAAQGAAASASAASASASSAGQAATSAGQSATAAAGSATTAGNAAQTATTKAGEASASASAAAASETAAQTAQTAAETAAGTATASATTAATKAGEAAQSASSAAQSKTDAEAAATRAETAAASLTVDSALSDSSVNPVQNKVVTAEFTNVKSAIRQEVYNGDYTSALKGTQPILLRNYSVGQTVDLSPMSTSGTEHYTLLIDVSEGDIFHVNLTDGSTARPWAFLDASHKLLSMAAGAGATNTTLTAPSNSAYLLLQCGAAHLANAKIIRDLSLRYLQDDIANKANEARDLIKDVVSVDVTNLGFIVGGMDTNGNYQSNQKYRVVTQNKPSFPVDIRICLTSTAYRYYLIIYNTDGTIAKQIGWINNCYPFAITAGTAFKLMVSRVTEITSETDNVAEFSAITSVFILEDFEKNALHNAVYNGDYRPLLRLSDAVPLSNYTVGQTVDLSPINDIAIGHLTTLIDNVIPGEKYLVNATDGSTARPWAFLDADFKLISMASTAYAQNVELTAPSDSHYLLIQVSTPNFPGTKINRYLSLDNSSGGGEVDTGIVALNARAALTEKLIETKYCGNNNQTNLMLLHFSDIHGSIDNIIRILDLKEAYTDYVDDVIHSGDSVATYFGNDNPFATSGGNQVLNLIGNHDCWIQGDTWPSPYNATAQQTYAKFIAPFISSWDVTSPGTNLCYYYKDYADYAVRLICLDCMHYDSAQENWFTSALSGAKTNGYSVIVVNHYPPQSGVTPIDCTFTSYGKSLNSAATPPEGTQIERLPESAYTIVDEFMTDGGNFICWFAGHTHFDFVGTVTNHANQVVVIINCGVVDARYGTDKRVIGTKTQDCVNAIGFDTTNHIIKICRVGVSMDWLGRVKNLLSINYATRTLIANS